MEEDVHLAPLPRAFLHILLIMPPKKRKLINVEEIAEHTKAGGYVSNQHNHSDKERGHDYYLQLVGCARANSTSGLVFN